MNDAIVQNTLYVTTEGVYLHLDHETIRVEREGETLLRVPLHHLSGVVVFGHTLVSPGLLACCAEEGRAVVWLDRHGRFAARLGGPVSGNVLLRRDQLLAAEDPDRGLALARSCVAGKIHNARQMVLRSARDLGGEAAETLRATAAELAGVLPRLATATTPDQLRGHEGRAAAVYFATLETMLRPETGFSFTQRTRRPPRDPFNALLSFLYTLLTSDCQSALETVGLDPQVGYLHGLRPGRAALALDLAEELRPLLADRLALTLINRRQLTPDDFESRSGGSVRMTDDARRTLLTAWQERKRETVRHPGLDREVPWGLIPFCQARILARAIRGDLPAYEPFLYR